MAGTGKPSRIWLAYHCFTHFLGKKIAADHPAGRWEPSCCDRLPEVSARRPRSCDQTGAPLGFVETGKIDEFVSAKKCFPLDPQNHRKNGDVKMWLVMMPRVLGRSLRNTEVDEFDGC